VGACTPPPFCLHVCTAVGAPVPKAAAFLRVLWCSRISKGWVDQCPDPVAWGASVMYCSAPSRAGTGFQCTYRNCSCPPSPLCAGTCALTGAAAASAATYGGCAGAGGAVLAGGAVADASRALFTYTNATCSYPSAYPALLVQTHWLRRCAWLRPCARHAACTLPTTLCGLTRLLQRTLCLQPPCLGACPVRIGCWADWTSRGRVVTRACPASARNFLLPRGYCCPWGGL